MKLILWFMLFIPVVIYCQETVSGKVIDEKTNEPVSFASVYINGTTFGTITDNSGCFRIRNVAFPCELVVSHVSYQVKAVVLTKVNDSLIIKLLEREILIEEVNVRGKNFRKENLYTFKKWFLGTDIWGANVNVRNDSSLLYKHIYEKVKCAYDSQAAFLMGFDTINLSTENTLDFQDIQWRKDSVFCTYLRESAFVVRSKAPLIIDMPLLGYTLRLDLAYAKVKNYYTFKACSYLGYYHFEPVNPKNRREEKRISKNRKKVYYNSSMHFCRSFYSNALDLNGYRIFEEVFSGNKFQSLRAVNLDTCLIPISDDLKGIVKLKDKKFIIYYYPESSGEPKVILNSKNDMHLRSVVYFLSDTSYIRSDGTVPDFSIMFTGSIGNKKVGTMLPGNYQPAD